MIDSCNEMKEQIACIINELSDLSLSLETLCEDVWEKYKELNGPYDDIQLCLSNIDSARRSLKRTSGILDDVSNGLINLEEEEEESNG